MYRLIIECSVLLYQKSSIHLNLYPIGPFWMMETCGEERNQIKDVVVEILNLAKEGKWLRKTQNSGKKYIIKRLKDVIWILKILRRAPKKKVSPPPLHTQKKPHLYWVIGSPFQSNLLTSSGLYYVCNLMRLYMMCICTLLVWWPRWQSYYRNLHVMFRFSSCPKVLSSWGCFCRIILFW